MRLLSLFSGNLIHTPVVPENSRPGLLKKHGFSNTIGLSLIVFGFVFGSLTARAEVDLKEQVKILNKHKSIKDMSASLKRVFKRPADHREIDKAARRISKMATGSKWWYEVKGKEIAFMVNGRVLFTFRPVNVNKGEFLFNGHKFVLNSKLSYKRHKARMSKILRRQAAGLEQFFIDRAHAGWFFANDARADEVKSDAANSSATVLYNNRKNCGEGKVFQSEATPDSPDEGRCITVKKCIDQGGVVNKKTGTKAIGRDEVSPHGECVEKSPSSSAGKKKCSQNNELYKTCVAKNQEKTISEMDEEYRRFVLNYGHFKKGNNSSGQAVDWEGLGLRDCSILGGPPGRSGNCVRHNKEVASADTDDAYDAAVEKCGTGPNSSSVNCREEARKAFDARKKAREEAIDSGSTGDETGNYKNCLEEKKHLEGEEKQKRCSRPGYAKLAIHPQLFHLGHRLPLLIKKSVQYAPDGRGPVFLQGDCMKFATDDAETTEGWGMTDKAAGQYCERAEKLHHECVRGAKACTEIPQPSPVVEAASEAAQNNAESAGATADDGYEDDPAPQPRQEIDWDNQSGGRQ